METATIIAILNAIVALGPKLPEIIAAIDVVIANLQNGTAPTAEQKAVIDSLLEKAHAALQAAAAPPTAA